MAENLGVKIEAILKKKIEKVDIIKVQLKEVQMKVANIKESVSRLELEVQGLRTRVKKLEKNVEEIEEGLHTMKMFKTFNVTTRNWSMRFMT